MCDMLKLDEVAQTETSQVILSILWETEWLISRNEVAFHEIKSTYV